MLTTNKTKSFNLNSNKFRLFDKQSNTIVPQEHLNQLSMLDIYDNNKYIIQFWSGKVDKNKEEIYDGDLVETSQGLFLVSFQNAGFMLINPKTGAFFEYMSDMCDMCGKVYKRRTKYEE